MAILGAMACPCTEPAVISSPTSMASCGPRRSPGCSSSTCRAFGEIDSIVAQGSTSGSTKSSFGCPSDGMSRFHPAFSEPSGGGTCG